MKFGQHYLSEKVALSFYCFRWVCMYILIYDSVDFQVSEVFCKGSRYDDIGYVIIT